MPHVTTASPVLRHQQDFGENCGRACAQMLISHVAQPAAPGGNAVSVGQDVLQTRELSPKDAPDHWFTHPDELQDLLARAPELAGSGTVWNVVARDTLKALLAIVLDALTNGMPSVITT